MSKPEGLDSRWGQGVLLLVYYNSQRRTIMFLKKSVTRNTNLGPFQKRWRLKRPLRTAFLIGALALMSNWVYAVPMMASFQGYLKDANGHPLNTTVNLTFALYKTPEGGTPLWREAHPNVTVTQGVFGVRLGSVKPFSAEVIEGVRYLGVTLGNEAEIRPRQALTSVVFALRAGVAESVAAGAVLELTTVKDDTAFRVTDENNRSIRLYKSSSDNLWHFRTADGIVLGEDGSNNLVIPENGNVGIGTTNPSAKLEVNGDVSVGSPIVDQQTRTKTYGNKLLFLGAHQNTDHLWMARYNVSPSPNASELRLNIGDDDNHLGDKFSVGVTSARDHQWHPRFVVQGDGNVGIGITNPSAKLEVNGDVSVGSPIVDQQTRTKTYGNKLLFLGAHQNTDHLWMARYNVSPSPNASELRLNIGDDDNHPGDKFSVGVTNAKDHQWHPRFVVQGDGNVGIGTITPQYKLDVNGTIRGHNVSPSDLRLKQNIQPLENPLAKVEQLRGVSFEWKAQNASRQIGMIAQEVEKTLPELVSTDSEGYKSIAYDKMTAVLVGAVNALKAENEALKAENKARKAEMEALKAENEARKAEMEALKAFICKDARQKSFCQ
jgi:hypothetical protein